jgi:hypothetical protein
MFLQGLYPGTIGYVKHFTKRFQVIEGSVPVQEMNVAGTIGVWID